MKLYIGGAFQGQEELARLENPGAVILTDFHESAGRTAAAGEDPRDFAGRICREHPDVAIVANETGAGIVPMDAAQRAFREAAGRALCVIAQNADTVIRVVCGIGVRIK